MIRFKCPGCGTMYRVHDSFAGRHAKCRTCGQEIEIPASIPQVAPAVPPDLPKIRAPQAPRVAEQQKQNVVKALVIGGAVFIVLLVAVLVYAFFGQSGRQGEHGDRQGIVARQAQRQTQTQDLQASERQADQREERHRAEEETEPSTKGEKRVAKGLDGQGRAAEAQRAAHEKQHAEEERQKAVILAYRNAPDSARTALNVLKKLEARIEAGITYVDYTKAVGEAWAEVKVFVDSPEARQLPEFNFLLVSATNKYKLALDVWRGKLEPNPDLRCHERLSEVVMRECWRAASRRLEAAQLLISDDGAAEVLPRVTMWQETDNGYDAAIRSLLPELILANLQWRIVSLQSEVGGAEPKTVKEYQDLLESISDKLTEIVTKDSASP